MLAHSRWMTLRLAVLAVTVLGVAYTQAMAASAYDSVGTASTAASVGSAAVVDMLPPDGTTEPAPLQMDGDGGWDMGSGWWIVMLVMMVLFWGGVIAVVVWGVRQFTGDRRRDRSALDIAKERLAGGEITKEEFDRIRGDLA